MSSPLDLPSLESRRSMRSQVIHALRAALVTGQMQPGAVYSAPTLAAQFGVSPTPVREAMVELAKEGLVTVVPNKGFRVRELSERELDEITAIRLLLEVPVTASLAGTLGADRLAELRPMAQAIVDLAAAKDLVAYVEADRQFHLSLLAAAGNQQLVDLVGELRARSRLLGLGPLADTGELAANAVEHVDLLDLIEAGDAAGVEALMRVHIGHVRGRWAGRPEGSTP